MIHFNPTTKTFNLLLSTSVYAFQIDHDDRVIHLGWFAKPTDFAQGLIEGLTDISNSNGPASFEWNTRRDELVSFGDVTYHETALKISFENPGNVVSLEEAPDKLIRDVRPRYVGHEVILSGEPGLAPAHGQDPANVSQRETLRVTLVDANQKFQIVLCYRITPECDVIERWCELANFGDSIVRVEACAFASLHVPNGTSELTTVAGAWAREFSQQREHLPIGLRVVEGRTLQTGHASNPFFFLNRPGQAWEDAGDVYFGALAYSGAWRIAVDHLPTLDVRVHAGYNPVDFELVLLPGEHHATPQMICGLSVNGWGGASRRLQVFARERILPCTHRRLRPVLYNSWEATYFDLSEAGQIELARKAAAMGVELYCLDDGWFGGRRHDRAGLGDWQVSRDVFPRGLAPLVDEVRRLGMTFGLWVEPEMVNPDSDLYRKHPDWVLHFPGRPRTEARNQLILDYGRREVIEYIHGALDALVSEYRIDFFKWDMNRNSSEPGSVAGKGIWRGHVAGVYEVMDRLRARHPGLDIQSCSGGGGRIDFGILGRTDQVWTSDNTDALDRIRIQEGFSLAYPARVMESWVTHDYNHQTGRRSELSTRFDVAMRGALGIGSSLNRLSERELADYAKYIAHYKRMRDVVQNGVLYRLQRLEEHQASIVEYVAENGTQAVYSIAVRDHQNSWFRPAPALKGLHASAVYAAINVDDVEEFRATGYQLMTLGIPGHANKPAGFSTTLFLSQVQADGPPGRPDRL